MAFGLPLGFLTKGKDQISAKTECGEIYEIDSLINTLHKGVRYSMTTSQLLTVAATRRLRNLTRCTNWFYQYTNAKSGDDFTYVARHQLQKVKFLGGHKFVEAGLINDSESTAGVLIVIPKISLVVSWSIRLERIETSHLWNWLQRQLRFSMQGQIPPPQRKLKICVSRFIKS